jgi:hypothetical protein
LKLPMPYAHIIGAIGEDHKPLFLLEISATKSILKHQILGGGLSARAP